MRKFNLIVFFFILGYNSFAQHIKEYKIYHEDGSVWIAGQLITSNINNQDDYLLEKIGLWTIYYDDGVILLQGNYKNGFPFGEWVLNYPNGTIQLKGNYISITNKRTPNKNDFFSEWKYIESIGEWKSFWIDGVLANIYTHNEGEIITKIVNTKFENNYKLTDDAYAQGQKVLAIAFAINNQNQQYFDLIETNLDKISNSEDFYRTGIWKEYFENGSLRAKGEYTWKTDKPIGQWNYYNENGELKEQYNYDK